MELGEAFEILVNKILNREKFYSLHGKIKSVNESDRTCVVEPIGDEADVEDVRLQGSIGSEEGFVLIPTVDSVVSVTFVNDTNAFISLCTKIDKILIDTELVQFNGGDNGGLILIKELVKKISALEKAMNTHIHPTTATIGPTAVVGVIAVTVNGQIQPVTQKSDLEDTKVTH